MRKALKWAGIVILIPIILFITLAILIYIPPVQNWVVRHVAEYASEQTGMSITVDRVHLEFPLDLGVDGIRVIQPNDSFPQIKDTVADIHKLVVDVQLIPLFSKQVEIDALEFNDMKLNTTNFIHEARIKGRLGRLYVDSHGIDLGREVLKINNALLSDANVSVELSDTVPEDTSKSENFWKIYVDKLKIENTGVTVHMPGDTLQVAAYMGNTTADNGYFDLYKGLYKIEKLGWKDGKVKYDNNYASRTDGLDYNHISLSDINISADTLYYCAPRLSMMLSECAFNEKSGISLRELTGPFAMDSAKIYLPALRLRTTESSLDARMIMDLNAFDEDAPGRIEFSANGSFGKQDIMRFMGGMPTGFIRQWPNSQLTLKTSLAGNMKRVEFAGLNLNLPTAFNINAKGFLANLTDMDKMKAGITLDAKTYNINFITALLPKGTLDGVRIPGGIGVKGRINADGSRYNADIVATEGAGRVKAMTDVDIKTMRYRAKLDINNLQLKHFLPGYDISPFTGNIYADGRGTDIMARSTSLDAKAVVENFAYGSYRLDSISAEARVSNGVAHANIDSNNDLLKGQISLNALTSTKMLDATISADIAHADLYNLHITDKPFAASLCCHLDMSSDMKEYYKVQGTVGDLTIRTAKRMFRPDDIVMDVLTRRDTTHAIVDTGDFHLKMDASGGYKVLMSKVESLMTRMERDRNERRIDYVELRKQLPQARIYLATGQENPFCRFLAYKGYTFDDVKIDMASSPETGINGDISVYKLTADSIQLDTVRLAVNSCDTSIEYHALVHNGKDNPQYTFRAYLDGALLEHGANANIKFYDARDRLGLKFGAEADMVENGLKLHVATDNTILGYKEFSVNEDNYIFMGRDRRISAKLNLIADDGQGVQVYSNDSNEDALQDITVSLNKFDLEKIMAVLPYMPKITGTMNGDVNVVQTTDNLTIASTVSVDNMTYEGNRMGNVATEFVYMPKEDGTHVVDGILTCNGYTVASISGTYMSEGDGVIDARLRTDRLPLMLVNGFIPDKIIGFKGYCNGEMTVKGDVGKPQINGEVKMDSCYLVSVPYGVELRFSDKPLRVVGNHLLFDNFEMFARNDNSLNINGDVDFTDLGNMGMNLRIRANDYQIIDSKENNNSIAYGKAFVNFYGMLSGYMDNLKMRGKLDVLASTDVAYILRDSPLTTDNQMEGLVKFTNFNDTAQAVVSHPQLSGFDMDLTMSVAQGAHVMCYLNADHSNYLDLMGGGDLRMSYNSVDDLRITGRYTLNNGEMKYSLPVIPLKTFTIQDGSYIEFTGDPMNPKLNITATERVKSSVSSDGGQGRTVDFDCGVVITKTLSDMGLEFTLDAPEDMSLHNELAAMSVEQRGKLAVTMLTTGMYLSDGNTDGFSMNSALNSFLQGEINSITGNALRTLDLSFGMDNATDASGNMHTDYSFKFAKRFWNNRLKIVVGGKVSTGSEMANQNESFFDNVTFEYRLDNTANKYVKLFYDNNAYDWLEGTTSEYGVGFIWRRSLQHFKDIFRFGKEKANVIPNDTVKNKKNDE